MARKCSLFIMESSESECMGRSKMDDEIPDLVENHSVDITKFQSYKSMDDVGRKMMDKIDALQFELHLTSEILKEKDEKIYGSIQMPRWIEVCANVHVTHVELSNLIVKLENELTRVRGYLNLLDCVGKRVKITGENLCELSSHELDIMNRRLNIYPRIIGKVSDEKYLCKVLSDDYCILSPAQIRKIKRETGSYPLISERLPNKKYVCKCLSPNININNTDRPSVKFKIIRTQVNQILIQYLIEDIVDIIDSYGSDGKRYRQNIISDIRELSTTSLDYSHMSMKKLKKLRKRLINGRNNQPNNLEDQEMEELMQKSREIQKMEGVLEYDFQGIIELKSGNIIVSFTHSDGIVGMEYEDTARNKEFDDVILLINREIQIHNNLKQSLICHGENVRWDYHIFGKNPHEFDDEVDQKFDGILSTLRHENNNLKVAIYRCREKILRMYMVKDLVLLINTYLDDGA